MKKIYLFFTVLLFIAIDSQVIEFSDPNFKYRLLHLWQWNTTYFDGTKCYNEFEEEIELDANSDGEISYEEASQVYRMYINFNGNIWDVPPDFQHDHYVIDGLEHFVNLNYLNITGQNEIQNITFDIEEVNFVKGFGLGNIRMLNSSFDFSNFSNLIYLGLRGEYENVSDINLLNNNNLIIFHIDSMNSLSELNLSNNALLDEVFITNCNNLSSLILPVSSEITKLYINRSSIDFIDFSNLYNLEELSFFNLSNNLTNIDLSLNPEIERLRLFSSNLESVNLKNGSIFNEAFPSQGDYIATGSDSLNICLDDHNINSLDLLTIRKYIPDNLNDSIIANIYINDFCSGIDSGAYSNISGTSKMDINNNGYDEGDISIPFQKLNVSIETNEYSFYSSQQGKYNLNLSSVYSDIAITPEPNSNLFSEISPSNYAETLPLSNPVIQNFSFSPTSGFNDVEVFTNTNTIIPGTTRDFIIYVKNNGSQAENATVTWQFQSDYIQVNNISENPISTATNAYTWNIDNLGLFETKEIIVNCTFNTPENAEYPLNSGDILNFTTSVSILNTDVNPSNNEFVQNITVINSFDPNDKTCLNGNIVDNDQIGEYLYYQIRFENLGTANAQTITVVDSIDISRFEINTLEPIGGSHDFQTEIKGNVAIFTFADINLHFEDESNDGFVLFKIKTLDNIPTESIVDNQGDIYFDYNYPVTTNNEQTLFTDNLGLDDIENISQISIIPNPVKDNLKIQIDAEISSIEVYDTQGKLVKVLSANENNMYNVDSLPKGIYLIKIITDENLPINSKFIKQ